ncbi:37S ribosomal protein S22 [Rhodotorula kratochvilovae]
MLPRSVRAAAPAGRRKASSAAIDRLSLDIFAAHNAEQERASGPGATTKSAAARRGESLRGDVQLPRELQLATNATVEGIEDKTILRNHALDLYARLQRTSGHPSTAQTPKDRQNNSLSYDTPTSLAYLAGLMPQVYAAMLHAFDITKQCMSLLSMCAGIGTCEPERIVDYGREPGSARRPQGWLETPIGSARESFSCWVFGALPLRLTDGGASCGAAASAHLDAKTDQLALPASVTSLVKLHLSPKSSVKKRALALALTAFLLREPATREQRENITMPGAITEKGGKVEQLVLQIPQRKVHDKL